MILPLQEHVLSYSMCLCITGIFFRYACSYLHLCTVFFPDMHAYIYIYVLYILLELGKTIYITESDQLIFSCTWNYYGSNSNQHCNIIKKKS